MDYIEEMVIEMYGPEDMGDVMAYAMGANILNGVGPLHFSLDDLDDMRYESRLNKGSVENYRVVDDKKHYFYANEELFQEDAGEMYRLIVIGDVDV